MKGLIASAFSLAMAAVACPAMAASPADITPIRTGPVTLRPDRAYILYRTNRPKYRVVSINQDFLRVPSADEMAAFRSPQGTKAQNLFQVEAGWSIDDKGPERVFLIEAPAGEYLLYGFSLGVALDGCACLGTVKFQASPGVVTDLGSILTHVGGQRSVIPELVEETGLDLTSSLNVPFIAQAVRPAGAETFVPPVLAGLARRPAEFFAVGSYVATGATLISRIAPMPGVIQYQGPDVIDARTGAVLP